MGVVAPTGHYREKSRRSDGSRAAHACMVRGAEVPSGSVWSMVPKGRKLGHGYMYRMDGHHMGCCGRAKARSSDDRCQGEIRARSGRDQGVIRARSGRDQGEIRARQSERLDGSTSLRVLIAPPLAPCIRIDADCAARAVDGMPARVDGAPALAAVGYGISRAEGASFAHLALVARLRAQPRRREGRQMWACTWA